MEDKIIGMEIDVNSVGEKSSLETSAKTTTETTDYSLIKEVN